ncbi:hypothetical protein V2W45_1472886 [Cenococcum geophilum]
MASLTAICLFSDPLLEHLEALTRIWLLVLRLLNIIKDLFTKEISELAKKFEDFKVELRLLPKGAPFKVPLKARWQPLPKKKYEPADEVDEDIKEDKEQPFNEPSVLYDEVLGGLEDEVVILEVGEDDNSWLNNAEYLIIIKSRYLSYSINLVERRAPELKGPILN